MHLFVREINGLNSLKIDHFIVSFNLEYYCGKNSTHAKCSDICGYCKHSIIYYNSSDYCPAYALPSQELRMASG